ncbi:MAG: CsbD family protein [Ancrocorticia sp.]|jgi:uncharacterized protein YjbJ (UPF0337 family)|nr:CsbD family protein [Ancrocorticia sp.]MCI2001997.1 CsbD family protein [Ancrocorticia sp.]
MNDAPFDKAAGKAKEFAGKATGDKDLEAEGKLQNLEGKISDAVDDAASGLKAAGKKIKEAFDKDDK